MAQQWVSACRYASAFDAPSIKCTCVRCSRRLPSALHRENRASSLKRAPLKTAKHHGMWALALSSEVQGQTGSWYRNQHVVDSSGGYSCSQHDDWALGNGLLLPEGHLCNNHATMLSYYIWLTYTDLNWFVNNIWEKCCVHNESLRSVNSAHAKREQKQESPFYFCSVKIGPISESFRSRILFNVFSWLESQTSPAPPSAGRPGALHVPAYDVVYTLMKH